jgi:hypothetical protein
MKGSQIEILSSTSHQKLPGGKVHTHPLDLRITTSSDSTSGPDRSFVTPMNLSLWVNQPILGRTEAESKQVYYDAFVRSDVGACIECGSRDGVYMHGMRLMCGVCLRAEQASDRQESKLGDIPRGGGAHSRE